MLESKPRLFGWLWPFNLVGTAGLALLVYLSSTALQTADRPEIAPTHPMIWSRDWAAEFPIHIEDVTQALAHLPFALPTPTEEPRGAGAVRWQHRLYELTVPAPADPAALERMLDAVRRVAPNVIATVTEDGAGGRIHVGVDGLLTHTLILHWLGRHPRVAIIIDDLGNDLLVARALAGIEVPLTFAVAPSRPFSKEVAELATLFKREVLVDLAAGEDTSADASLARGAVGQADTVRELDARLAAVPYAVGAAGVPGAPLTGDDKRMPWVLDHLKEKGLFVVETGATANNALCSAATLRTVPCARRDLVLDATDDDNDLRSTLQALLTMARTRGDAIAVVHARPSTVSTVAAGMADFTAAGVDVVPVSNIVTSESPPQR